MIKMIIINGFVLGGMYAILAIGFSLVFGVGRILNMAHTSFYMLTAFLIYFATSNLGNPPVFLWLLLSVLIVGVLGMGFYRLLFDRVKEHETATLIIGIGLSILIQEVLLLKFGGHYKGIKPFVPGFVAIAGVSITYHQLLAVVSAAATLVGVWLLLKKTKIGIALRAVSQDREIANLIGINVGRICMITFGISAALAGIAGVVIAPIFMLHPFMWVNPLIITLAAIILGGMGSIKGGVIAAFILAFVETTVVFLSPEASFLRGAISLTIMIIVLLVRPQGLFGIVFEEELL